MQVACTDAVREVLESWDLAHTDRMLEKLAIDREARREAERRRRDAEKNQCVRNLDIDFPACAMFNVQWWLFGVPPASAQASVYCGKKTASPENLGNDASAWGPFVV